DRARVRPVAGTVLRDACRRLAGAPRSFVRAHAPSPRRLHRSDRRPRLPRTTRDPGPRRTQGAVMTSNADLIGRDDVNDYDAILAVTNTEVDEVQHAIRTDADAIFTWNYERSRPALVKLYEKAKTSQWNANDLPWDIEVDQEQVAKNNQNQNGIGQNMDLAGT